MIRTSRIITGIGIFSLLLTACSSGGGGGSNGGGGGGGGTTLSSPDQGAAAAGAGTSAATAAASLADIGTTLGSFSGNFKPTNPLVNQDPRFAKMVRMARKAAASPGFQKAALRLKTAQDSIEIPTTSEDCTDGGSVIISGSIDIVTGEFTLTIVFDQCREGDTLIDGTMTTSGTSEYDTSTGDVTLNTKMTVDSFTVKDFDGSTLLGTFVMDVVFDLVSSYSSTSSAYDETYSQNTDGSMTFTDNTTGDTFSIDMDNLEDEGSSSFDSTSFAYNDTLNGKITESYTEGSSNHSLKVTYDGFITDVSGSGALLATALSHDPTANMDITYDGKVTIDFTPNEDCVVEGTFTFETVTALHFGFNDFCPVDGLLRINGGTDVQANSDGSMDVTVGSDTTHFDSCDDLDVCTVEDFGF